MKKKLLNRILSLVIIMCTICVIVLAVDIGLSVTGNTELKEKITGKIYKINPIKTYKNTVITEENYNEVLNEVKENAKNEDEVYYAMYSMLNYIAEDGLKAAFANIGTENEYDEKAMYSRIYGKTIGQLINEGKDLMKQNNITVEQYKKNLEELSQNQ